MKKLYFIITVLFFFHITNAQEKEKNSNYKQEDTTHALNEVVITANKVLQKVTNTGKVITYISREQIERSAGYNLAQLLNQQAGIIIPSNQGPLGSLYSINIEGAGPQNTLFLINGMPIYDPSGPYNSFDINHLDLSEIDHIEILKGIQSTLYGSDAVGGVINIITQKSNTTKSIGVHTALQGGSYGTYKALVGISGQTKKFSYDLSFDHLQSNGFSAATTPDSTLKKTGAFPGDNFNQNNVNLNTVWQIEPTLSLSNYTHYDNYIGRFSSGPFVGADSSKIGQIATNALTAFSLNKALPNGNLVVNFNYNYTNRNYYYPASAYGPSYTTKYIGESYFAESYLNHSFTSYLRLLAGIDFRGYNASTDGVTNSLYKNYQWSGYANLSFFHLVKGFQVDAGVRETQHSVFGNAVTYTFNPSYLLHDKWKFFVNIASGFRAPSLYNLASQYGNLALKPELSQQYDGGVQYIQPHFTARIDAYYRNIFNSIVLPPPYYIQYLNLSYQKNYGGEIEATYYPIHSVGITFNYTHTEGSVKIPASITGTGRDSISNTLFSIPKDNFFVGVSYTGVKKLYLSANVRWQGIRTSYFYNNNFQLQLIQLNPYYNLNAYIAYQIIKEVKVFLDLQNITNRSYVDIYGYATRLFNFTLGFKMNW